MAFGAPTRYLTLDPKKARSGTFEAGLHVADEEYSHRMHNLWYARRREGVPADVIMPNTHAHARQLRQLPLACGVRAERDGVQRLPQLEHDNTMLLDPVCWQMGFGRRIPEVMAAFLYYRGDRAVLQVWAVGSCGHRAGLWQIHMYVALLNIRFLRKAKWDAASVVILSSDSRHAHTFAPSRDARVSSPHQQLRVPATSAQCVAVAVHAEAADAVLMFLDVVRRFVVLAEDVPGVRVEVIVTVRMHHG